MTDPEKGISVLERSRARTQLDRTPPTRSRRRKAGDDPALDALGSGSDFTPFLQHLGIAALNIGYGGEDDGGAYHSIYDSFDHYTRFGDPEFDYGVTLAKTAGRARAAPGRRRRRCRSTFDRLRRHGRPLRRRRSASSPTTLREETEERNRRLDDKIFQARWPIRPQTWVAPPRPSRRAVPQLRAAPERRRRALKTSAAAYDKAYRRGHRGRQAAAGGDAEVASTPILMHVGARAHPRRGPAAPALVRPPDLRPRLLHRLRREDAPRRARGHRAARLEGGDRPRSPSWPPPSRRSPRRSTRRRRCWGHEVAGRQAVTGDAHAGHPGRLQSVRGASDARA